MLALLHIEDGDPAALAVGADAAQNARLILDRDKERIRSEQARTTGAVHEIEEWIGTEGLKRMEAYDISNTSGFANVGSMVVYEDGTPKRSDYRKFRIQSVAGPDDYACMKEVLTRRFMHAEDDNRFGVFPDIILMDGGRGQVNIALGVLEELGIDIPVAGMGKDDNHRTRGMYYNNVEIPIDTRSEGFKLLTRIQDEAHRFAIEYHRSLRSGTQVHSVLDEIPGVGPARRKSLMKAFDSIEDIRNATPEDISSRAGIPIGTAISISEYLNSSGSD